MLNQTKDTIKNLKKCGLIKNDFRVNTPFNYKYKGYDNPQIYVFTNKYNKTFYINKLLKYFNVVVTLKNNKIVHLSIYYNYDKKGALAIYNLNTDSFKGDTEFLGRA